MPYQYQEFPKVLYHQKLAPEGKLFRSAEETKGLSRKGWVDTPAKFKKPSRSSRLRDKYKALGPFEKFGVWAGAASIAGLVIALVTLRPSWIGLASNELLVQTGTVVVQANVSDPTIEVYYPVPIRDAS